jgi:hypothetical protein
MTPREELDAALARAGADPFILARACWPGVRFYDKQRSIILSVRDNKESFVPAGNKLGKDFVAGFIVLWFFLTRHPCRVVTTSAKDDHLRVLWGEIGRFLQTSRLPLTVDKGGVLQVKHQDIRKFHNKERCPISYLVGMVASQDTLAAMQGHHANPMAMAPAVWANLPDEAQYIANSSMDWGDIPRTLFVVDEASSVPQGYWTMAKTWFERALVIGNPWPCNNFFRHAVEGRPGTEDAGGDLPDPQREGRYLRRVIHISATDSPNIKLATKERAQGFEPSYKTVTPGVKGLAEYTDNLRTMTEEEQSVSLKAEFYKGRGTMLFPREWLDQAMERDLRIAGKLRTAKGLGIDPAEGQDKSAFAVVDELGLMDLMSLPTPDTNVVVGITRDLMQRYKLKPEQVCFDAGGGGKQHADRMRAPPLQMMVRTVAFGEAPTLPVRGGLTALKDRKEIKEDRYVYVNRRAEMYGELRLLLDPAYNPGGWAIPRKYAELLRQLGPLPLKYNEEGRIWLPPKHKKDPKSDVETIVDILGCSPDESDSVVLAVHAMLHRAPTSRAGAVA